MYKKITGTGWAHACSLKASMLLNSLLLYSYGFDTHHLARQYQAEFQDSKRQRHLYQELQVQPPCFGVVFDVQMPCIWLQSQQKRLASFLCQHRHSGVHVSPFLQPSSNFRNQNLLICCRLFCLSNICLVCFSTTSSMGERFSITVRQKYYF